MFALSFFSAVLIVLGVFSETALSSPSGQDKKKPPSAEGRLEETDFGRALLRSDIEDYRKEYEKLTELSPKKALAILTAKDTKKNSALHYMVQVREERREAFAGEIFRYSLDLMNYMNHYDIFDDWNTEGLTPKDLAERDGNSTAAEYLRLVENMAKNQRETRPLSGVDETKAALASPFQKEENGKKGVLGGLVLLNGAMFTLNGILFRAPELFLIGLPQLFIGGPACYEAFKEFRSGKKPTNPPS